MTNAMQPKARIGALSAKTGVPHQIILQNYMMERLLARMAASSSRDAFILKGGFLLSALFGIGARTTMDMDITVGDRITPGPVRQSIPLLLEEGTIPVRAYNFETILAEKADAILSRAEAGTRMRDFYDISMTLRLRGNDVSRPIFAEALRATAEHRGTESALVRAGTILARIAASPVMQRRWSDYVAANPYATGLRFSTVCEDLSRLVSEAGLV